VPRATIDIQESETFDLKTLVGGTITLRRMSYGEWLERQTMAMDMSMSGRPGDGTNVEMKIASAQLKVTVFEFSKCIVDHNLEDHDGQKLDFIKKAHVCIALLDPKVGQEIGQLIESMNSLEGVVGNSPT
jgi:hypothetical protein